LEQQQALLLGLPLMVVYLEQLLQPQLSVEALEHLLLPQHLVSQHLQQGSLGWGLGRQLSAWLGQPLHSVLLQLLLPKLRLQLGFLDKPLDPSTPELNHLTQLSVLQLPPPANQGFQLEKKSKSKLQKNQNQNQGMRSIWSS